MKAFADKKLHVAKMTISVYVRVEKHFVSCVLVRISCTCICMI